MQTIITICGDYSDELSSALGVEDPRRLAHDQIIHHHHQRYVHTIRRNLCYYTVIE